MNLERLGDAAIVVSVVATTLFVWGYAFLAPWWRTAIGRSLFISKSWIAALTWMAFLRTVMGVPEDNILVSILRAGVWVTLPFVSSYTFWALMVKTQIVRGRKWNAREQRRARADQGRDHAGTGDPA